MVKDCYGAFMKANEDIICDCPDSSIRIRVIRSTREGHNNAYIEIVVVVFRGNR